MRGTQRGKFAVACFLLVNLAACDGPMVQKTDQDRYCELITDYRSEVVKVLRSIESEHKPDDAFLLMEEREYRQFIRRYSDNLDEMKRIAPAAIRKDVEIFVNGLRDSRAPNNKAFAALERLWKFETENCGIDAPRPGDSEEGTG